MYVYIHSYRYILFSKYKCVYGIVLYHSEGKQDGFNNYIEHLTGQLKAVVKGDNVTEITSALYRLTAVMVSKKGTN